MNWKMTLSSAALAMSALFPTAALADSPSFGVTVSLPPVQLHVHNSDCHHGNLPPAPPSGVPQASGRYELQTVSNWLPGYYEQVRVPGQCFTNQQRHHGKTVCTSDRYENRWVEGRYEQVQQWVWVDYGRYDGYANQRSSGDEHHERNDSDRGFGRRHGASRGH